MKFVTNIVNKKDFMSEEEFKSYLLNELRKLELEYQKTIIYSLKKYDKFSRYLDKSKMSSTKKKLKLLQKEVDALLNLEGSKYENYSYMLNKYDYKYNMDVYNLVCELKKCDDLNRKYELLKRIKKIYRPFFVYVSENKLESKKSIKEINSFMTLINDKYRITQSKIKNIKKKERDFKKRKLQNNKEIIEKSFSYGDFNTANLIELVSTYRDNIREGHIDNTLIKNLLLIMKRIISEESNEELNELLYSVVDSIKYRKSNTKPDSEERIILNTCSSLLKKYLELNVLMDTKEEEPHDYKFDIVIRLLNDKENYPVIKKLVEEFPQIVNIRNNKKSILVYILMLYINNYKMILKNHKYYYNVDFIKEVYRLFANCNSLYLSYEDKKEIERIINNYITEVTELDISSKKQNYAINEIVDLKLENVIKEKNYLKNVDKTMFDANIKDIFFLDYKHSKRPSEIDLTDERTFLLNDPYTCYSYTEGKGVKSLKIHTADLSNLVKEGDALDHYFYNSMIRNKKVKNDILSYLRFREGDEVSAFTYEIILDNDRKIKDFKIYRSRIKVESILDYSRNEEIYKNLRKITTDYISKYGDNNLSGLAKIEYILNSILQKEFVKITRKNDLPLIASKIEYKNGLSPETFSDIKNICSKLENCDSKRINRILSAGIEEKYYDDRVRLHGDYDLHLTGTPDYIYLLNQRMIKELINGEIGYGTEFYSRQKERTISKYADLKDTLNDVLNYKKEEDFDYKQRRNYKTYKLTKED